jgi:membrane protease YdiL (CAAX protease family)
MNRFREWRRRRAITRMVNERARDIAPKGNIKTEPDAGFKEAGSDSARAAILAYLGGIAIAELVTVFVNTGGGMICHVILLFALIGNSVLPSRQLHRNMLLVLALGPLIRIISLAMPLERFSYLHQYLILSVPLLFAVIGISIILHLEPSDIGIKPGKIHIQALVAFTGVGFGLADYYILKPDPLVASLTWQLVVPAAFVFLIVACAVELTFRGVMQHIMAQSMGRWGWIYVAFVFAVLQIGYRSVAHGFLALFIGLFFGWTVRRTGSILGAIFANAVTSVALFIIIPLLISQ